MKGVGRPQMTKKQEQQRMQGWEHREVMIPIAEDAVVEGLSHAAWIPGYSLDPWASHDVRAVSFFFFFSSWY